MHEIIASLQGLAIGAPQLHRNLALFPLLAPAGAADAYVLLDEALDRKIARITEVSDGGRVPELAFENASAEKILLVDGDELIGAKQNRVVNISILVGGGQRVVIPVSCVEHGRWSYRDRDFRSGNRTLFAKARARKMSQVSFSMSERGSRESDQHAIWADVAEKSEALCVESPTMSMSDLYDGRSGELDGYATAFHVEPGQRGAVVAVDGKVAGMELFDSPGAFSKYLGKLVRSYAMDALETGQRKRKAPAEAAVRQFLDALQSAAGERFAALGEGEDIRLKGAGIAGGALAADGRVVHLAGYAV